MEQLLPLAEQLDRAAVELKFDHPIHNRLAIILIDNAIELMVRESLLAHVIVAGDFQGLTPKDRVRARSRNLPDRLSVLTVVGELTQEEADFILAVHDHRNIAYHEGHAREPYLRAMAFLYFRFACSYLTRFEKMFYSWSSAFRFTDTSKRYHDMANDGAKPFGKISRPKLAAALLARLPDPPAEPIQIALARDLEEDRDGIVQGFRFLIDNTRPKQTAAYLLAKAQWDYARDQALERRGLESTMYDTPRRTEAAAFVKARQKDFKPRYRALPHGSWSQSIARVRDQLDPHTAVVQFHRLRKGMAFLREAISHAAMRLEGELDRD